MSAKSILEADGKAILNFHLTRAPTIKPSPLPPQTKHNPPARLASLHFPEDANVEDILNQAEVTYPWLLQPNAKFVAKPDQLIKRRGKSGLLALNKTWPEAKVWIAERAGKAQKVESTVGILRQFLVEPFVPHPQNTEYYININSVREVSVVSVAFLPFRARGGRPERAARRGLERQRSLRAEAAIREAQPVWLGLGAGRARCKQDLSILTQRVPLSLFIVLLHGCEPELWALGSFRLRSITELPYGRTEATIQPDSLPRLLHPTPPLLSLSPCCQRPSFPIHFYPAASSLPCSSWDEQTSTAPSRRLLSKLTMASRATGSSSRTRVVLMLGMSMPRLKSS